MKKIMLTVLLTVSVVTITFAQNGVIRELTGDVELRHEGASAFVPASAGAEVAPNTIVSTGFRSSAVIAVGSAVITVRPLTRLSLTDIQSASDAENVNVNLQAGRVRVEVKPPSGTRSNLTVQSTSASASVRGTTFEFDGFNINTEEGNVIMRGTSGVGIPVTEGNASFPNTDGSVVDPVTIAVSSTQPPVIIGSQPSATTPVIDAVTGDLSIDIIY